MDYKSIGLDSNLQPLSAPITQSGADFINGLQFDSNNDRSAISGVKIRNFNFSSGFGGTLTLGGSGNGNGVLEVQNSGGTTVVTADNTGITIKDSGGTTIIDSTGLVSANNFSAVGTTLSNQVDNSGTTLIDLSGMSLVTRNLTRSTNVLVLFNCQVAQSLSGTADAAVNFQAKINGSDFTGAYATRRATRDATSTNGGIWDTVGMYYLGTIPAGYGTINVQWSQNIYTGFATASVFARNLTYILLGS